MNFPDRQGDTYIIIYFLTYVQFVTFRRIGLFECSLDGNDQLLKTSVTSDGHAALNIATHIHCDAVIAQNGCDFHISLQDVGIAERFKELLTYSPIHLDGALGQSNKFNYKGLQSYK